MDDMNKVDDQVVTPATTDEVEAGDQPEVAPVAEGETEAGEPAKEDDEMAA